MNRTAVLIGLLVTALGCGGDAACVPGEQVECACPGGTVGAQACNAEGSAFGDCSCDGTNPSAGGGGSGQALDACEHLSEVTAEKIDQCDIELSGGAPQGGSGPCDAEQQAQAQCITPCVENTSCAALNGDDLDALEAYADCLGACTE